MFEDKHSRLFEIDLSLFHDYLTLARTRPLSFRTAAESMGVSQTVLTKRIQRLEDWWGRRLIDRSVLPVRLTPAGQVFFDIVEKFMYALEKAWKDSDMSVHKDSTNLGFATLQVLAVGFLPGWLERMKKVIGPFSSWIDASNIAHCFSALREGVVNFALCYDHDRIQAWSSSSADYESKLLDRDTLVPVCAPEHGDLFTAALRGPSTNSMRVPHLNYAQGTYLRRVVDWIVEGKTGGRPLAPYLEDQLYTDLADVLRGMAIAGHGLAWIPGSLLDLSRQGQLKVLEIENATIDLDIRIFRLADRRRRSGAMDRFWDAIPPFGGAGGGSGKGEPRRRGPLQSIGRD